jgi:hypothetical protein
MVPVDLRPPERMGQLGNEFGLVLLDLAVTKARADHRLALTKARMDALKHSPEPLATRALLDLMGRLPKVLEDFSNDLFGRKASLVMTNVTGPREELYLAGAPIERMLAWAPHPGKQLGMAVSIFSYKGMAGLTVIGDAHLVPDPETITEEFNREFRKMQKTIATADAAAAKVAKPKAPAKKAVASKPPAKKAPVKAPAPKATAKARPATEGSRESRAGPARTRSQARRQSHQEIAAKARRNPRSDKVGHFHQRGFRHVLDHETGPEPVGAHRRGHWRQHRPGLRDRAGPGRQGLHRRARVPQCRQGRRGPSGHSGPAPQGHASNA